MRKKLIINISKKVISVMIVLITIFSFGRFNINEKSLTETPQKLYTSDQWLGNQDNIYNIFDLSNPAGLINYISFDNFITNLATLKNQDLDSFIVVIEKALDLQYLTMLANDIPTTITNETINPQWYLSLNYVLGRDIVFAGEVIYPIGNENKPFNGSFDGQGFSLSDLSLAQLNNINYEYYTEGSSKLLEYYALFSYIGIDGVVKNLSIIDLYAAQVDTISNAISQAAPLAGKNSGLIENVSVVSTGKLSQIFRTHQDITVSTMVSHNTSTGIIRNSFVGVVNGVFEDVEVGVITKTYPVIRINDIGGQIKNVYCDMDRFIPEVDDINQDIIEIYDTSDFQNPQTFNTEFSKIWFFNSSYSDVILNEMYPILQGLRLYEGSTNTYVISSAVDMIVFSKLVNNYAVMANRNYILTNCINMLVITKNSYKAPTVTFGGVFSSEVNNGECLCNHDISNAEVKYHSIWNLQMDNAATTNDNYKTYGLVKSLGGTIKNINLVNYSSSLSDANSYSSNIIYAGSVAGEVLSSGVINNVNVYGKLGLPNSKTYGAMYIGGLVGSNSGLITNSSFNGEINGGIASNAGNFRTSNGIGGIAGLSNNGSFINVKNLALIIGASFAANDTSTVTYVGGIIGNGTYAVLENVVNSGLIISSNPSGYLPQTYVGGIISRLTSLTSLTDKVYNEGDVRLIVANRSTITNYYAAGFGTVSTNSQTQIKLSNITNNARVQIASSYTLNQGVYTFNEDFSSYGGTGGVSFTSGGTTVNPTNNIGGVIKLTGTLIINTQTAVEVNGIYQDQDQTIDLGMLYRYAPVVFSLYEGGSTQYLININQSYNSGNLNFVTTRNMYNQKVQISANTYGDYIFFDRLRNEGDINVDINYASTNTFKLSGSLTDYSSNFRISGLVGTINSGFYIRNSYNGGNITVKNWNANKTTLLSRSTVTLKTQTLQYMLYIGGIAFKNNNTTDVEPKDNIIISSTRKGGIHNCLNDGDIYVDLNLYGCSRIGGIASLTSGLISSCFNTGNIYNYTAIYLVATNDEMGGNQFEVEAGGIACMITSDVGQVMDSANYGDIMCVSPIGNLAYNVAGWLNAAGIVGRNEKKEDNLGNPDINWSGKIQFCVNYGNIYAWNAYSETFGEYVNGTSETVKVGAESSCKAAGIMAIGVINVINCANYGDIYSRYLSGGIFGLVDGTKFKNINKSVYIANSINYGKVRRISSFNLNMIVLREKFTTTDTVPSARTVTISGARTLNSMYGGAIGYIYANKSGWTRDGFDPSTNAVWSETQVNMLDYLQISFLINFDEKVNMIGSQSICIETISGTKYSNMVQYMATTNQNEASMYPFNSTSGNIYSVPKYTLSTNPGGIFHEDFPLRSGELNSLIITNDYIRNYINFVEYEYTNEVLVDKLFDENKRIGIYALASSKGILNGKYIPDNIEWGSVDTPALDLIIDGEIDNSWRGDITDNDSIKYKFNKGMKQLKLSIATTVYDLQLVDVNNEDSIIGAPSIDNINRIITFYIGDNEGKEASSILHGSKTIISNPTIDSNAKTVSFYQGGQLVASYSYATGNLVRTDSNNTFIYFDPQNTQTVPITVYKLINSYTAGQIASYYVNDNGSFRQATATDALYTITVTGTGRYNYTQSTGNPYNYTYNTSTATGRYRITNPTEVTNRLSPQVGPYFTRAVASGTNYHYYGVGSTISEQYKLYQQQTEYISYPTTIYIYDNDYYYDNYFTVNTNANTYTLSEGASLELSGVNSANNVRIAVPAGVGGPYTSSLSNPSEPKYLYVKSQAGTIGKYEIRIQRTESKVLYDVAVNVSGGSTYTSSAGSIVLRNGSVDLSLSKTTKQTLNISFKTVNMPDKHNLLLDTQLRQLNTATGLYEDYSSLASNGEIYSLNGGIVVNKTNVFNEMLGEYESAVVNPDGTFPNASVAFVLSFERLMAAGTYQLQITIGNSIYYIQFQVAKSNVGLVEELTYTSGFAQEEGSFVNENNANYILTTLLYDSNVASKLSAMMSLSNVDWDNLTLPSNAYISDLKISPYAKILSITYSQALAKNNYTLLNSLGASNYNLDTNDSRLYTLTYTIQDESGTNREFKHYFVEKMIDTTVQNIYMDGINQGQINELSFVRTNKPTVKIFYQFENIDITNIDNFSASITYDYDTQRYPKQSDGSDNLSILESTGGIIGGLDGITISFLNDVACDYTISISYTRIGEITQTIVFEEVIIYKTNNTNSSLVRILFSTESPFTTTGTIIYNGHAIGNPSSPDYIPASTATVNSSLLTTEIYELLNNNITSRIIKSMPNLIYYNEALPKQLSDDKGVYNRYDIVGFVSKTELLNYQPTFTLPAGAIIYQLDENNEPLVDEDNNLILNADYINTGSSLEFDFVHYRIYSEASSVDSNGFCIPNDNNDNYTDYYIYVLDVSYNVYFDVIFAFEDEEILADLVSQEEKTLLGLMRYEEILDSNGSHPAEDISIKSNLFYFFRNSNNPTVENYNHHLAATSSGYFKLDLDLPKGYTYEFLFSGDKSNYIYQTDEQFFVESKIVAYRYTLTITIKEAPTSNQWGQNGSIDLGDIFN